MLTLYPAQKKAHKALIEALKKHRAALDSSDTGTGKTLKAVEVAKSMGLTPFVVCPKTVIAPWEDTLDNQGVGDYNVYNWEKLRTGNTRWVKKVGRKAFKWTNLNPKEVLLVFDECHKA